MGVLWTQQDNAVSSYKKIRSSVSLIHCERIIDPLRVILGSFVGRVHENRDFFPVPLPSPISLAISLANSVAISYL